MRTIAHALLRRWNTLWSIVTPLKKGLLFFLDELSNRKLLWSAQSRLVGANITNASSISEELPYLQICKFAVEDNFVFNSFKSNVEYRAVLEHCSFEQGKAYLDLIELNSSAFLTLKLLAKRDFGKPLRYRYKNLGRISPTQIRYAKVTQDLEFLFGSLNGMKIAEIGAGYGGQANHILASYSIENYSIYDLEWPGALAIKYLKTQDIDPNTFPRLADFYVENNSDLVLSNYAFSELSREVQEIYLRTVILPSKKGYFIYNHIHETMKTAMSAAELVSRIPGAEIFEEVPLTFPGNMLVVWGHEKLNLPQTLFKRM